MSVPLWIPLDLETAFKNSVVQAFGSPQVYHPLFAPLPWMVGFFGRSGMHKLDVMRFLCAKYGLSLSTTFVTAKMGKCKEVLDEVACTATAVKQTWEESSLVVKSEGDDIEEGKSSTKVDGPRHLICIDKADVLCYEADSEVTLLRASELNELCESNRVIIMGIFDRLPGESDAHTSSPWVREAQSKYWAQFDTLLYIEAPNAECRAKLFKHYVTEFTAFYNSTHSTHTLDVSTLGDKEYERLADFSGFATPENILYFLRKVFGALLLHDKRELTVEYVETFLNHRYGAPHICDFDARDQDNRFATACGRGPAVAPSTKILNSSKNSDPPINVTQMSEANVDLNKVMQELGESKGWDGFNEEKEEIDEAKESVAKKVKIEA